MGKTMILECGHAAYIDLGVPHSENYYCHFCGQTTLPQRDAEIEDAAWYLDNGHLVVASDIMLMIDRRKRGVEDKYRDPNKPKRGRGRPRGSKNKPKKPKS